jgi:hypothetical protein
MKDMRFTQAKREQKRLKRQFLKNKQIKDEERNYRTSGNKTRITTQNDIQRELSHSKKVGRIVPQSKGRNLSQEVLTFYAKINQEISPHVFRRKKRTFFSDSLSMTHRKNAQLQKEQRNKINEELDRKLKVSPSHYFI